MKRYRAQTELAQRIEGITESLESGDGGVRDDLYAALAEVDALSTTTQGAVSQIGELQDALANALSGDSRRIDAARDVLLIYEAADSATTGGQ